MDIISPYILAIILGWMVAQGSKYLIIAAKDKTFSGFRQLYLSGNMPSAHSASVAALLTVIALKDGVDSGLFGLASLFAAIVMYDAMMVRRSSGEQGYALRALMREQGSKVKLPRVARGHEPLEVLVGAIIGVALGAVVFFATK